MKTIEEKAKAYDDALGWMRDVYPTLTGATKEDAEHYFPDLKESEDERNIDTIFNCLYQCCDTGFISGTQRDNALAWLEKQKEQKNPLEDYSRGYNDGYYHGVTDKEKKPVMPKDFGVAKDNCKGAHLVLKKQDYSGLNDLERAIHRGFLCAGVENVPVTLIKETAKECLAEIKPVEWSEEDSVKPKFKPGMANVLKSLRPQPKQEWSEEDEKEYNYIMSYLDTAPKGKQNHAAKWLKKRRPCPSWKPSEEQMKRLADAVESWRGGIGYNELKSLYNDLLKLK